MINTSIILLMKITHNQHLKCFDEEDNQSRSICSKQNIIDNVSSKLQDIHIPVMTI